MITPLGAPNCDIYSVFVASSMCYIGICIPLNFTCICAIYTRMHLYKIMICTDGTAIDMYQCVLLVTFCMVCYWLKVYHLWCVSLRIICEYRYIHASCLYTTITLHPPPQKVATHDFCLIMFCYLIVLCLFLFILVTDLSLCLQLFVFFSCCTATVTCW